MTSKAIKLNDETPQTWAVYRCPECGFQWGYNGTNEWCFQCGHSKVCEE